MQVNDGNGGVLSVEASKAGCGFSRRVIQLYAYAKELKFVWMLDDNVRKVSMFPRDPNRCTP